VTAVKSFLAKPGQIPQKWWVVDATDKVLGRLASEIAVVLLRVEPIASVRQRKPEQILHEAVRRMLPKNRLSRTMLSKLKIYAGDQHPHQAQQPEVSDLGARAMSLRGKKESSTKAKSKSNSKSKP
jgi:large subunit ribosomal protein L13